MIKRSLLAAAVLVVVVALPNTAFTNSSGAPAGRTGAPPEGGQTCNTSGCHAGSGVNSGGGSITISGPTSYSPSQVVNLSITVAQDGAQRIGFQVSVVDASNMNVGTLQIVDAANTRFASNNPSYITHSGAPFNQASRTFNIAWLAPAGPAGPVRFFVAGNAANGNGSQTGDQIYTETFNLAASGVAVEDDIVPSHFSVLSAYPNPVADQARVAVSLPGAESVSLRVVDLLGRVQVSRTFASLPAGRHELPISLAGLTAGAYLVVIQAASGATASRRLTVVR